MPCDPKECHEHAKRCCALAADAPSPVGKECFEALANRWLALAADLDAMQALYREWGTLSIEPPLTSCA
jgi:hypothetical protein